MLKFEDKLKHYIDTDLLCDMIVDIDAFGPDDIKFTGSFTVAEYLCYDAIRSCTPHCYHPEDIYRDIVVSGFNKNKSFVPAEELNLVQYYAFNTKNKTKLIDLPFEAVLKLMSWHFWLWEEDFENGLVTRIKLEKSVI